MAQRRRPLAGRRLADELYYGEQIKHPALAPEATAWISDLRRRRRSTYLRIPSLATASDCCASLHWGWLDMPHGYGDKHCDKQQCLKMRDSARATCLPAPDTRVLKRHRTMCYAISKQLSASPPTEHINPTRLHAHLVPVAISITRAMFNATYPPPIPYRPHKKAFTRPSRGLNRRSPAINDMYMPVPSQSSLTWPLNYLPGGGMPFNRVQEFEDAAALGGLYGDAAAAYHTQPRRGRGAADYPVASDRAAKKLNQVLRTTSADLKELHKRFENDVVDNIGQWTPEKVIDTLWTARLDWDGAKPKARETDASSGSGEARASSAVIYGITARRLLSALENMRNAEAPAIVSYELIEACSSKEFSPELFKHTMGMLQDTVKVIEGLVSGGVRKDRKLMKLLLEEMGDAMRALERLEEMWKGWARRKSALSSWEDVGAALLDEEMRLCEDGWIWK